MSDDFLANVRYVDCKESFVALVGNRPELLAPAGGRAQLEAAVLFGADAVYLACDRFGMRQRAENFKLADLPAAVAHAHASGVVVHAAVNTSMDADDLMALPAYSEALAAAGVDAFIVGDLGALRVVQRHAPGVDLHASQHMQRRSCACLARAGGQSRGVRPGDERRRYRTFACRYAVHLGNRGVRSRSLMYGRIGSVPTQYGYDGTFGQ